MATGTIKNTIYEKTGSFTPNGSAAAHLQIKQFGKIVSINGWIENISITSSTASAYLGTFAGINMPPDSIRTLAGIAAHAYEHPQDVAYLYMLADGKLYCHSTATGTKAAIFSFSYIAN